MLTTPFALIALLSASPAVSPLVEEAPDEAPAELGASSSKGLAFDWDGKTLDGTSYALPLERIVLRFTPVDDPGLSRRWVVVKQLVVVGENRVPVRLAVRGVAGGLYDLVARVEHEPSGQTSNYSEALRCRVRVAVATAPQNLRVVE